MNADSFLNDDFNFALPEKKILNSTCIQNEFLQKRSLIKSIFTNFFFELQYVFRIIFKISLSKVEKNKSYKIDLNWLRIMGRNLIFTIAMKYFEIIKHKSELVFFQ